MSGEEMELGHVGDPSAKTLHFNEKVDLVAKELRELPQIPLPLRHHFASMDVPGRGIYLREGILLKDVMYIGQEHKHEHFNIFFSGKALLCSDGEISLIDCKDGPVIVKSGAGVRKVLKIIENLHGLVVHATNETNLDKLWDELVVKSESFKAHELAAIEKLKLHAPNELLGQAAV